MSKLTFEALRCHFQTGRSYVISGEGRNRVYGYRTGVQAIWATLSEPNGLTWYES